MIKIGIIAGDGNLPLYIGKSLLSKNYDVTFLSLNNKNNKFYNNYHVVDLDILSVKKIFKVLDSNKIKHIIFAGSIKRPGIKDLGFDLPIYRGKLPSPAIIPILVIFKSGNTSF